MVGRLPPHLLCHPAHQQSTPPTLTPITPPTITKTMGAPPLTEATIQLEATPTTHMTEKKDMTEGQSKI